MHRKFRDERLYDRGGRFIWARVRNEAGLIQRLSTKCTNEDAATRWANEYEKKAADPSYRRAAVATLATAIAEHLDELRRKRVSAATMEIAETKLGHFVRLWGEDWPLLRITNDLVLQFIDTREREGRMPHTVSKELKALKGALKWARFRGVFPAELDTVFPPNYSSQHKPRTRWLTPAEVQKLFAELPPRRAAHVAFIIATGARREESERAERADVHLDSDNPYVEVRGTKTEKAKGTIPITGLTHPFIVFALQHAPGHDVLFDPWLNIIRDLAAACERAGIKRAGPNDLRRTYAKWHRLAGASAEHVGVMLRHTTDKLAQTTYGQISGADLGPGLRRLLPIHPNPDVSILYSATVQNRPDSPNENEETMGNSARPEGFGPPTSGFEGLTSDAASSRRSRGTKLGLAKAAAARGVPELYLRDGTNFPAEELSDIGAVFPFAGVRR